MNYRINYIFTLTDRFSALAARVGKAAARLKAMLAGVGSSMSGAFTAIKQYGEHAATSARRMLAFGAANDSAQRSVRAIGTAGDRAQRSISAVSAASQRAAVNIQGIARAQRAWAVENRASRIQEAAYERRIGRLRADEDMGVGRRGTQEHVGGRRGGGGQHSGGGLSGISPYAAGAAGGLVGRMTGFGGPTVLAAGAGFAVKDMLKNFAEYESGALMLRTIGKLIGQSDFDLDAQLRQTRQLAADTIFSPEDVLKGQLLFLKAGRGSREAMSAIPHTLSLASAAKISVADATDASLNLMAQGRIKGDQMKDVIDALTATFVNSKSELQGLAKAANYAVPQLTQIGIPIEQQFAALGALAEGGQSGTRGGMQVRQIFASMTRIPFNKKKLAAMRKWGVDPKQFFDKGQLKDFPGFIEAMGAAEKRSGNTLLARLFPANAMTGMQTLIAQMETYKRILESMPAFKGATAQIADVNFQGLKGALLQLKSVWEELGISFGESGPGKAVEAQVRNITESLNSLSQSLSVDTFFDELLDPTIIGARMGLLVNSIGVVIAEVLLQAVAWALDRVGSVFGAGRMGDWLRKTMIEPMREKIARERESLQEMIKDRQNDIRGMSEKGWKLAQTTIYDRQSSGAGLALSLRSPGEMNTARINAILAAKAVESGPQAYMLRPSGDDAWNGRDSVNGAQLAASIPQSVTVDVRSTIEPVTFKPAIINVNVTGQVNGPVQGTGSGNLEAEPSRGTSTEGTGSSRTGSFAAPGLVAR